MAEREVTPTPNELSAPEGDQDVSIPLRRQVPEPDVLPLPRPDPSDDSPTVISKVPSGSANLNNSLRGRTLAHFELIEPIGVGGMAAVIRARDKQLERIVALKILPPETAADEENVRRFHNEARAAAKLDHENIARVFYCGEDQGLHFIAFEFVEGINLRALLQRRGCIPVAEAVHYMLQIATGLAHAAARGVVHRDIKPSNIIISPNGRAKLVDMGLARHQGPRDDPLTQSGVTLGTFDYISPEQALEPRDADARSDIYSLGCTFYHMVTGHPPVPEGTAAKKLHHHQHVAPVDPRQLNPDIPDDIAAILSRMMAKDPKDRYQRPEHLVQHLLVTAQKVGAPAEVPDGVLFVDAPLPTPPARRPLLMVGLAALALAVVLLLLSLGMPRSRSVAIPKLDVDLRSEAPTPPQAETRPNAQPAHQRTSEDRKRHVTDEASFHEAFAGAGDDTVILLDGPISLTKPGPVFQGKPKQTLRVQSADPDKGVVLHFAYQKAADPGDMGAALTVDGGQVVFRDIRFEIEAEQTPENIQVAAIAVRGAGHAAFEKCTFWQKAPVQRFIRQRETLMPIASVAVTPSGAQDDRVPYVSLSECYFQEGQDAVVVEGLGDVRASNCGFGKHGALFHLRPSGMSGPAELQLAHCSAFVVRGPAFRLDGEATCHLAIKDSIFSCPDESGTLGLHDQPHLFRQTSTAVPAVRYIGERNCFHNLNALWVLPTADAFDAVADDIIVDWQTFLAKVEQAGGRDRFSTVLDAKVNPWNKPNPLREEEPALAFQVNPTLRELREPDLRKPRGLWTCAWGPVYSEELPDLNPRREDAVAIGKKQKIVDPSAPMSKDQIYPTLTGALEDARPGDEILIKEGAKNHLVEVTPIRVRPELSVTLKPYPDQHPILTLAADADEEDAALFRLSSGQLKFEQMEFALRPDRQGFKSQVVVAMKGNAQCSFRQCLFTLADEAAVGGVHLSVVALLDPKDAMKSTVRDSRPAADIQMENCLVRGEGDILSVRASRPFELALENCIAALSGCLVSVEGCGTEPAAQPAARIRLDRVTTYLTDHLVQLRAGKNGKGLVPTVVSAVNCLFAAAGNKAFVFLDGLDGEKQMKELFSWEGRHNAYDGFDKLLDQLTAGESMVMLRYDQEKWRMFANESDPQPLFLRARCFDFDRPLAQVMPEDFRAKGDMRLQLLTYGSTLTRDSMPHGEATAPEDAGSEPN
jgi:serine/threonine protein kinase